MGYKLPKTTALLVFENEDYKGAEIRVRLNVPVGIYLDVLLGGDITVPGSATSALVEAALKLIVDWNLEDDNGKPVPLTLDGLTSHVDLALLNLIVSEWAEASNPSAPLEQPSANGKQASAPSLPRSRGRR